MTGLPHAVHAARKLRRMMTLPEVLLWRALRRRPDGLKFRRQHAIGDYVVDFYCASARLAIEIDGRGHDSPRQAEYDLRRDAWLARNGVRTLRMPARELLNALSAAIERIVAEAIRCPVEPPLYHRKSDGPPPPVGEDFTVDIMPLSSADGGGFAGVAPELPGCRSDGETPEAALANTYDAIGCWIEAAVELGRVVPEPRRVAA